MKTSLKGIAEIAEHEGIVPAPYLDSVGVWTWGIGHTKNAGGVDPSQLPRGMPANTQSTIDEAIRTFAIDLVRYEARVNNAIKVHLKQHEFDALVSFDFNTGGIARATLTKRINAGDPKAFESFMGWLKPPEIRKRRTAEMNLFRFGDYDNNGDSIPIWNVSQSGKLQGIHSTISGNEMLKRMGRDKLPSNQRYRSLMGYFRR